MWTIIQGDARRIPLGDETVQCVVTSPPFWGLRDYGLPPSVWGGEEHEHEWGDQLPGKNRDQQHLDELGVRLGSGGGHKESNTNHRYENSGQFCPCGAWFGVLGLEPTPELYIEHMVEIFREVRRVLRKDGTVWANWGDSYNSMGGSFGGDNTGRGNNIPRERQNKNKSLVPGLKPKDLCGIPWRVALALQADGWWLRSDIIWSKPNPMPESVTDRPTRSHEYVFLLTKAASYYYDADAVREISGNEFDPEEYAALKQEKTWKSGGLARGNTNPGFTSNRSHPAGRNLRSVWHIPTQPFLEAHFATFPQALVEPCIKAGTSEKGACADCGGPWERVHIPSHEHAKRITTYRTMNFDGTKIGAYIQEGLDRKGWVQKRLADHFPSVTGGLTGCVHNWVMGKNIPTSDQYRIIKDVLELGDLWDELLNNPATGELQGWQKQDGMIKGLKGAGDHIPTAKITLGWQPTCRCYHPCEDNTPQPCLVLDPFAGSGTVGIVCIKLNRSFVGIELKPDYCEMANKRVFNSGSLLAI